MTVRLIAALVVVMNTSAHAEPSPEQLFNDGQAAFDRHDYVVAIAKWEESYQRSHLPLLKLNIAQAYRLAGDCRHALAEYKRYLMEDQVPGEQRDLATGFVTELEQKCGLKPEQPSPALKSFSEVEHPRSNEKVAGLVTAGAGLALVGASIYYGRQASTLGDQVTRACSTSCDWATEHPFQERGHRDETIEWVTLATGVTAIGVGAAMYYFGAHETDRVVVAPVSGGAAVSWRGSW